MIINKIIKKMILLLIFILISCIIFTSTTYATTIDEMMSQADAFLGIGDTSPINQTALKTTSDYIYNTLLVIAVAIAVIVGTYLGIKFMMESAEDKAKIKEALIPFVVGCFVIFGAFGIWRIVVSVGTSISGGPGYTGSQGYTGTVSGTPDDTFTGICPVCKRFKGDNGEYCEVCLTPYDEM